MPPPEATGPFARGRFHFTSGLSAGEIATIRDDEGHALLTYRSFASVVGIVAALVAAIVMMTGIAATAFLIVERHPLTSISALVMSLFFALLIVALVPAVKVVLLDESGAPAIVIAQRSRAAFPSVTHAVVTPNGDTLALLTKNFFARLGRNRWTILDPAGRFLGFAAEESFGRAILRKLAGKFSRAFEADVHVEYAGRHVATIIRRPNAKGEFDVLESLPDVDRRVAVALATLILGSEP